MGTTIQLDDPGTANRRFFLGNVLPFLPLPGKAGILDLGCGDGYYCDVFEEVSRGLGVGALQGYHGIDLDEASLEKARSAHPDGEFQRGDITNGVGLREIPYGLALCCETLSILPDIECVLERMLAHTRGTVAFDFLWSTDGNLESWVAPLKVLPPFEYQVRSQRFAFDLIHRLLTRHPSFHVRYMSCMGFSPVAFEEFTGVANAQVANVWWVLQKR